MNLGRRERMLTFRPIGCERTQVAVHFQYAPPGGSLGRQVAAIFGADPDVQVRDDLARLRELPIAELAAATVANYGRLFRRRV